MAAHPTGTMALCPVRYKNTTRLYAPEMSILVVRRSDAMPERVPEGADSTSFGRYDRARWRGKGFVGLPLYML